MNDINNYRTSYQEFQGWVSEQKRRLGRISWGSVFMSLGVVLVTVGWYALMSLMTEHGGLPGSSTELAVDASGQLSVEQVSHLPLDRFVAVPEAVARGYTRDAHWFRITAPDSFNGLATVVVQPSYLDDVRIFVPDPTASNGWKTHRQGDLEPFAQRERQILSFAADVETRPGTTVYVRVQTRNASNIRVRLLSAEGADQENALTLAGVGLYCGAVFVLAFASLLSAVLLRDKLWFANALFQLATLATMFVYFGLANQFVFENQAVLADRVSIICGFSQYFFGTLLYRWLYRQYGPPAWLVRLHGLSLLIFPVQLVLMAFDQASLALQLYNFSLPFTIVLGTALVFVVKCPDRVLLYMLRVNVISTTTFFVLLYAIHLQQLESDFMQLYPGVFINLFTGVVLHMVLVRRNWLAERERDRTVRSMVLAQQHMEFQQSKREEDSRFLSMLLHEMRSPLSVLGVAARALENRLSKLAATNSFQVESARDVSRISRAVRQIRDMLQQVQISSQMEYKTGIGAHLSGADGLEGCNAEALCSVIVAEHEYAERLNVSGFGFYSHDSHDEPLITGSAQVVSMMVSNLIDNALKYAAPESIVEIQSLISPSTPSRPGTWSLTVANQVGPIGYPDPSRIFTKYYRAPGAHQYSGTGLGLYWVRGMARTLSGDLGYRTVADTVVFELMLPILADQDRHEGGERLALEGDRKPFQRKD